MLVMPGLDPAIQVLGPQMTQDVDARVEPGHDEFAAPQDMLFNSG